MNTVLEYIRSSLFKDLADKVVFVALTGLIAFVLASINQARLRHKYPLGGTYISHYDYFEESGTKLKAPDVTMITLRQHGRQLYGYGVSPRLGRRFRYTAIARSVDAIAGECVELPHGSHVVFYWRRAKHLENGLTELEGAWSGHSHDVTTALFGNERLTPIARVKVARAGTVGRCPHESLMAIRQAITQDIGLPGGITQRNCRQFAAKFDGATVGTAGVLPANARDLAELNSALQPQGYQIDPSTWIMHGLAVDPERRGRGIGSALVARLLAEAARGSASNVIAILSPEDADSARPFFTALGFSTPRRLNLTRMAAGAPDTPARAAEVVICIRLLQEKDKYTPRQRAQGWLESQWDYYIARRLDGYTG
jgi:GNAT superfamily N-acetyltransferase